MNFIRPLISMVGPVSGPVLALIVSICSLTVDVHANDVTVMLLTGEKITGRFVSADGESVKLVRKGDQATVSLESKKILAITNLNPDEDTRGSHRIRLVDGSLISIDAFGSEANQATVRYLGNELKLARRNIEYVLFDANSRSDETLKRFEEITQRKLENGDRLVVFRNENLDWLDGLIGDTTDANTQFQLGDRKASVKREKIAGMIIYHATGRKLVDPLCRVNLIDGSQMSARFVKMNGDSMELTLVAGDVIKLPVKQVKQWDFASGRFAYLSQMKPSSIRWEPLLASGATIEALTKLNLPRFNQSFDGGRLSLIKKTKLDNGIVEEAVSEFDNGWAARSGSKIIFPLNKQYKQLGGKIGFAPGMESGVLKLVIRGDGKTLFEQVLKASDNRLIDLEINIENVDRIIFAIEYHDGRSVGDELHFCDIQVSK